MGVRPSERTHQTSLASKRKKAETMQKHIFKNKTNEKVTAESESQVNGGQRHNPSGIVQAVISKSRAYLGPLRGCVFLI